MITMPMTEYTEAGTALAEEPSVQPSAPLPALAIHDGEISEIAALPLVDIVASPFNPRRTYNQAAMDELVESVRAAGVMQPILVRPNDPDGGAPGASATLTGHAWQVVYGHRRFLAAQAAGLTHIPAMIRPLNDEEAARCQAVENLQREDLTALDEAQGYAAYIEAHRITRDELAARIGKSRTHVYKRLALAHLVPEAAQALQDGKMQAEVATLIARVPPKLQAKALATLEGRDPDRDYKWTYRRFRAELLDKFSLDLKGAIFDTQDAVLVELAGACTACPKRSGMTPEIFGDIIEGDDSMYQVRSKGSADICTDPDCFATKKKAHLVLEAAKLTAKGATVVTGTAAKNATDASGNVKGSYIALSEVRAELKKIADDKKPVIVTIQDPRDGKTYKAVKRADLADSGVKVEKHAKVEDKWRADAAKASAKRTENEGKAKVLTVQYRALLDQVRAAAAATTRTAFDLQLVARAAWEGVEYNDRELMAELYDFKSSKQLEKTFGQMDMDALARFCMDCALVSKVRVHAYSIDSKPESLLQAAKHYGIDARSTLQLKPLSDAVAGDSTEQ